MLQFALSEIKELVEELAKDEGVEGAPYECIAQVNGAGVAGLLDF